MELSSVYNFDYFANVPKNKEIYNIIDTLFKDGCFNPQSAHVLGSTAYSHMVDANNIVKNLFPMYEYIEFVPGGGSMANMRAFIGQNKIKYHIRPEEMDIVMISSIEHSSITKYVTRQMTDRGYTVILIPVTTTGIINMDEFEKLLVAYEKRTVMISCMLINNETGIIQPVSQMIKLTKKFNPDIIFHSDIGCGINMIKNFDIIPDIATCSCYKFGGPHYGLLLTNKQLRKEYFGTPDVYNIYATALSIKKHMDPIYHFNFNERNKEFKNILMSVLAEKFAENQVEYVSINNLDFSYNSTKETVNNIFSFILPQLKASFVQQQLSKQNIAIGSGSACTTNEGSHTLKAMGFDSGISQKLIRLSFDTNDLKISTREEYINIAALIINSILDIIKSNSFLIANVRRDNIFPKSSPTHVILHPSARIEPIIETHLLDIKMIDPVINTIKITYGELNLKGLNKQQFIDKLKSDIVYRIKESISENHTIKFNLKQMRGFAMIHFTCEFDPNNQILKKIILKLTKISGLHSVVPMMRINKLVSGDIETINSVVSGFYNEERNNVSEKTFKIRVNITEKKFFGKVGREWEYYIGKYIKDRFNDTVNLDSASITIELFHDGTNMYVSAHKFYGFSGLPTGTEGVVFFVIDKYNITRSMYSMLLMVKRGCIPVALIDDRHTELPEIINNFGKSICTKYSSKCISLNELYKLKKLLSQYNESDHIVIEPTDISNISSKYFTDTLKMLKQFGSLNDMNAFCNTLTESKILQELEKYDLEKYGLKINTDHSADNFILNQLFTKSSVSQNGLLLISGGIDSPVVASKMLKNNISHDYVHFIADLNDEVSKSKIMNIVSKVKHEIDTKSNVYFVQFGELQKLIAKDFREDYRVMLYKIYMVKIANDLCKRYKYDFIAMGNSWGQVASQTPKNIFVTDTFSDVPIFSPLLGYNKDDIISDAKKAGTYEYSICNGNDCCVMFLPKNPILKASVDYIRFAIDKIGDYNEIVDILTVQL